MHRATAALAVAALLALAAPPAGAADPATEATRALLAAQKAALADFRAALRTASAAASDALGEAERNLASSGDASAARTATIAALAAFQTAVLSAIGPAAIAPASAAQTQLALLAPATPGVYPPAFYPGDRSPTGLYEEALRRELEKAYAKVAKRTARVGKRFEAEGWSFAFRLRPPEPFVRWAWAEGAVLGNDGFPTTIHLAVATRDLASPTATLEFYARTKEPQLGFNVTSEVAGAVDQSYPPIAPADDQVAVVTNTITPGVWHILAANGPPASVTIGVR